MQDHQTMQLVMGVGALTVSLQKGALWARVIEAEINDTVIK